MRSTLCLGLVGAIALVGCDPLFDPPTPTALRGLVMDSSETPIAEATVTHLSSGQVAVTDAHGTFAFETLPEESQTGLKVSADGRATVFRTLTRSLDDESYVVVKLKEAPDSHRVPLPAAGERVTVSEGLTSVTITGGSLVLPDGTPAEGEVTVTLVPFDPLDSVSPPADLETTEGKALMSAGMASIDIEQNGENLQPGPGSTIEWKIAMNEELGLYGAPEGYKAYYVDESVGLWKEEDEAVLAFDEDSFTWTAQLPHLSAWNVDYAWLGSTCVTGRVLDAHGHGVDSGSVTAREANHVIIGADCWWFGIGCSAWQVKTNLDNHGRFGFDVPVCTPWALPGRDLSFVCSDYPDATTKSLPTIVNLDLPSHAVAGQRLEVQPSFPAQFPNGTCTDLEYRYCLEEGSDCDTGDNCCAPNSCLGGICRNCLPANAHCSVDADCCEGSCLDEYCVSP